MESTFLNIDLNRHAIKTLTQPLLFVIIKLIVDWAHNIVIFYNVYGYKFIFKPSKCIPTEFNLVGLN